MNQDKNKKLQEANEKIYELQHEIIKLYTELQKQKKIKIYELGEPIKFSFVTPQITF
mgnify:CR=1 FL=1